MKLTASQRQWISNTPQNYLNRTCVEMMSCSPREKSPRGVINVVRNSTATSDSVIVYLAVLFSVDGSVCVCVCVCVCVRVSGRIVK